MDLGGINRLVRFRFEFMETICNSKEVSIEIIDNSERSDEKEMVEDFIQILTVFSCRLQGKRGNKTKKLIKELKNDD